MELWISLIALLIGLALGSALGYLLAQRRQGSGSAGGLTPAEASALNGQLELLQSQNKQLQGEGERAIRLDESLKAVTAQMLVLSTQAQDLQLNVTKSNSAMFEQIENMGKQNDSLVRETAKLAGALSKSQTRGQYGEAQLEMLLEGADLKEGIHFERQSYKNSGGEITRPDVKILMPGGTEIFVDSKFPFERFYEGSITEDLVERARLMKAHTEDLVGHINALAKREYQEGGSSVTPLVPYSNEYMNALANDYKNLYSNKPPFLPIQKDDGYDAFYHSKYDRLPDTKRIASGWITTLKNAQSIRSHRRSGAGTSRRRQRLAPVASLPRRLAADRLRRRHPPHRREAALRQRVGTRRRRLRCLEVGSALRAVLFLSQRVVQVGAVVDPIEGHE